MNERQKRFTDEYIATGNASEAARRAGYSKKTAYAIGERLLRNVEVREEIDSKLAQLQSERTADVGEVLEHLTSVLRGQETENIVTPSGKKFEIPVKEFDRLKAADMLLRVHGAYKEKVDVEVKGLDYFVSELKASFEVDS